MTPYQLNLYLSVKAEQSKQEDDNRISLAYMQALWTIQWLGKKKPESLEKILKKTKKETEKAMTQEETMAFIKGLNAAFGGETY